MEPVKKDMELLSNSMATYAHITANPESFALYFMMGVCFGLLTALCLLDSPPPQTPSIPERRQLRESSEEEEEEEQQQQEQEQGSVMDEEAEVHRMTVASSGSLRSVDVFASAEELEKARRLEERERIVREIWRNGQPDVLLTGTGTIGRVHYH
ncbi:hypothetical protein INR49_002820 [Caranx melampygus]|nr:hypothetical protein INR49_002820 [Caranx melampygus]